MVVLNILKNIFIYIRAFFMFVADGVRRFLHGFSTLLHICFPKGGTAWRIVHHKFFHFLLLPLVLIYYEILLRLFTRTPLFSNLLFPVLFAASFGFLLSAVASLFRRKIRFHLTNAFMAVIAFYFCLELGIHHTFQMYMDLSTIVHGAGNVIGTFGSDVRRAIIGIIPAIIVYFIPFILRFLFLGTVYKTTRRCHPPFTILMLILWFGIGTLGTVIATHRPVVSLQYAAQYRFDPASQTFGLTESTFLDFRYSVFGNPKAEAFSILEEEAAEENTEEDTAESEETIDYGYNVMDIDFDKLIAETEDEEIRDIHEYVSSLEPTNKNEYTGLFEGKNLITITAEAFSMQVINEELTPTLYRLANNGIKFTDFYQPSWGGSTSTGEFSILLGLVPTDGGESMTDTIGKNLYFTTGNQFQRLGYTSLAFHNGNYYYYDRDETHPNLGYDSYLAWGNGLEELLPEWSEDEDTFRATIETYIDQQPFNVYYMTFSGHCIYNENSEKVEKYLPHVKEVLGDQYKDQTLYYFCYQMELESALTTMVDMLEEAGIADDTVIVLCADHYPYGLAESDTLGNTEDYLRDLYQTDSYGILTEDQNALIIWSECIEDMHLEVDDPVNSLDILPTISNLFGLEYDSRLLVGRDVFSDAEPICVCEDYNFVTDKGTYYNGVFESTTGEEVSDDYLNRIKTIVSNKIAYSTAVLKYNYYNILFGSDE